MYKRHIKYRVQGYKPLPIKIFLILIFLLACFSSGNVIKAQEIDDCLACHDDEELTAERDGREVSLYIDLDRYQKSIHRDLECIDCHKSWSRWTAASAMMRLPIFTVPASTARRRKRAKSLPPGAGIATVRIM